MKKYIYLLIVVGGLLCIAIFYREDIGRKMLFSFSKQAIRAKMDDNEFVWFKYAKLDSLYDEKKHKYFLFIKSRPHRSEDVALLERDSTLFLQSHSVEGEISRLDSTTVSLAESVFPYLLDSNQAVLLCAVDSVVKGKMNRYRIRKFFQSDK